MSQFSSEDIVNYKGKAFPRETLWHKVKGLGWDVARFKVLSDEEITKVMDGRITPENMPLSEVAQQELSGMVNTGRIDLEKDVEIPGILTAGPPLPADEGPIPSTPKQPSKIIVPPGVRLDPAAVVNPLKQTGTVPAQIEKKNINIRPPRADVSKLLSILDAAFQLAQGEATKGTAKVLINTNGLERAFQALYPDLATKVLGRIDSSPDANRRGGIVLEIENESEDGYIHIVTTGGVITITGHNLSIKE